jgi:hypothetical protein
MSLAFLQESMGASGHCANKKIILKGFFSVINFQSMWKRRMYRNSVNCEVVDDLFCGLADNCLL